MNRNAYVFCSLVLTLAGLSGCSSKPPATDAKKTGATRDKIQGMVQIDVGETSASDVAMNAGGPSTYLWEGARRYRLFFNKPVQLDPGKDYIAEGVNAQKVIDEIGDPDQGKNGYPLLESCQRVVRMAWSGLAFDVTDTHATALRTRIKRYPARPVFLVTRITPVPPGEGGTSLEKKKAAEAAEKDIPEITVAAEKQRALLVEGSTVQTAPLWDPKGGTAHCKVLVDRDGKIAELQGGGQLCESVQWSQFRFQPTVQRGRPVKVNTEVEVRFDARK